MNFIKDIEKVKSGDKSDYLENMTRVFNEMIRSSREDIRMHTHQTNIMKAELYKIENRKAELVRDVSTLLSRKRKLTATIEKSSNEVDQVRREVENVKSTLSKKKKKLAKVIVEDNERVEFGRLKESEKVMKGKVEKLARESENYKKMYDKVIKENLKLLAKVKDSSDSESDDSDFSDSGCVMNDDFMRNVQ